MSPSKVNGSVHNTVCKHGCRELIEEGETPLREDVMGYINWGMNIQAVVPRTDVKVLCRAEAYVDVGQTALHPHIPRLHAWSISSPLLDPVEASPRWVCRGPSLGPIPGLQGSL